MLRLILRCTLIMIAVSVSSAPQALAKDKIWHIGFLDLNAAPTGSGPPFGNLKFFREGLGQLGYEEGRDYVIDARFADTDRSRLPELAKDLVDRNVDVIVTIGGVRTGAAKAATMAIPIVMAGGQLPVENGLVASLAHPGGNVTGLTRYPPGLMGKSLQLFKEAAPSISRLAVLGADSPETGLRAAAEKLNIAVLDHDTNDAKNVGEFEAILLNIAEERVDAVFVMANFTNDKYKLQLFEFLSAQKLPSMFEETYLVEVADGLMSYFTNVSELRRRAALFVDKILKGAKPSDLPVEHPTRFRLVINLKTAKMLGLAIPDSVLSIADKIIEE